MTTEQRVTAIQAVLHEVRPAIVGHGGDIELVRVEADIVVIRLKGACIGCPASIFTVTFGVEQAIKEKFPEIKRVMVEE